MTHEELDRLWFQAMEESIKDGEMVARYHFAVLVAAAELRRLHELEMDQQGNIYALEMARSMQQKTVKLRCDALVAQRDVLLDALKEIVAAADGTGWDQLDASFSKARAAIKQAEEKA